MNYKILMQKRKFKKNVPSLFLLGIALLTNIYSSSIEAKSQDLSFTIKWDEKFYNPMPLEDDVIIPITCDGAMVFRKVAIAVKNPLEDVAITLGRDDNELGFAEFKRQEYISGSFLDKDKTERFYLMAKYELTELQYQAITQTECPKPNLKLMLPKTKMSWFEAMQLADTLNIWIREKHPTALPTEDGQLGFLRLPTETEWEFAARGGIAVSTSEFRDNLPPMQGPTNEYIWFAGPQSANGKLQLVGRLKPNPLGLHDMIGNVQEMMFEPFRMNKLDRQHGQAGGFILRGASYLTQLTDLRTAFRNESPYYDEKGPVRDKTQGARFVIVSPAMTSTKRVQEIDKAWLALGNQEPKNEEETKRQTLAPTALDSLAKITNELEDVKVKQELESLRNELRANAQARDEQRDEAVRSALQLGAFLCTKLKDDGLFYTRLEGIYENSCAKTPDDAQCVKRKSQLDSHNEVLEFLNGYYADTLVSMSATYKYSEIEPQIDILKTRLLANSKSNLHNYLDTYWMHLQGYWDNGKITKQQWLENCKITQ
ncbi:SUMF1/EgtB/PvdO family nonheme iron enzyme [Thorsellia kenyensis]|uniref:SUMF1/EgtB/PvdO family nonheme iron enzyme n=1 Tax=Thorsellia kenyensis TaxID=1549888 RepID=A0ABV6CF21_9GAMM